MRGDGAMYRGEIVLHRLIGGARAAEGLAVIIDVFRAFSLECVLYGQPFLFRAMKNMYAFIADVVMLLVSLPVCVKMDDYLHRMTRDKR